MCPNILIEDRILASSANLFIIDYEKTLYKSLIYARNNRAPGIDPWKTLHKTIFMSEEYPLMYANFTYEL